MYETIPYHVLIPLEPYSTMYSYHSRDPLRTLARVYEFIVIAFYCLKELVLDRKNHVYSIQNECKQG